jgi:hypothetical protein
MFKKKELYNGIPNVTVWQVLRKRLRVNPFLTLATHWNTIVTLFLKHPV